MYKTPAMKEHDDNLKRIIELEKQVEQYKSDAELGRAVRMAFEKGGYIQIPSAWFDIDTEQDLLEWAKEVEK
jgi:hypothetical protein